MAKSHSPKRNREKFIKLRHKVRERRDPRPPAGFGPGSLGYHACYRKIRFEGLGILINKGREQMIKTGKKLFYYPCPQCAGYHLTHKPGGSSVEIKMKGSD